MSRLIVVAAFLNEADYLPAFLASVQSQTRLPERLLLVDDGSTDASPALAEAFAAQHDWCTYLRRPSRSPSRDRLVTAAEYKAFLWGVEQIAEAWDVVVKMDCDLDLRPEHFAEVVATLEAEPDLGICGAFLAIRESSGQLSREPHPSHHVRGPNKFYRRACFEAIQPVVTIPGWEEVDEVKSRLNGWRTRSVALSTGDSVHLRPTGLHDGALRAYRRWGLCAYNFGAAPWFVVATGLARVKRRPRVLGGLNYILGYFVASARRPPRAEPTVVAQRQREERARVRQAVRRGLRAG